MHNLLQQPRAGLSKNRGLAPRLQQIFMIKLISICRRRLLPDGSTTCNPISLNTTTPVKVKMRTDFIIE